MKDRDATLSVKTLFDQLECKRNVWSVVNDRRASASLAHPASKVTMIVACLVAHYLWQLIWSINELFRAL